MRGRRAEDGGKEGARGVDAVGGALREAAARIPEGGAGRECADHGSGGGSHARLGEVYALPDGHDHVRSLGPRGEGVRAFRIDGGEGRGEGREADELLRNTPDSCEAGGFRILSEANGAE